jgi:hypothetical protein
MWNRDYMYVDVAVNMTRLENSDNHNKPCVAWQSFTTTSLSQLLRHTAAWEYLRLGSLHDYGLSSQLCGLPFGLPFLDKRPYAFLDVITSNQSRIPVLD